MQFSPLVQLLTVAVLAYGAGLLLGLSFYRGEIGPARKRASGAAPAPAPSEPAPPRVDRPVSVGAVRGRVLLARGAELPRWTLDEVERGEDRVVASLLENRTAQISEQTYERVAARVESSTALQSPFVRREGVPLHLLNDVYLKVEAGLRREILTKYEGVLPSELEAAFERSRNRVSKAYGALPEDFDTARREVDGMAMQGMLMPPALVSLLRQGPAKRTAFICAFAKLADVNYELVDKLVATCDLDALAMLCRAADFDRALFVTLAMLIIGKNAPMGRVKEFGELYNNVPLEAAQRAIRFWKVRTKV